MMNWMYHVDKNVR